MFEIRVYTRVLAYLHDRLRKVSLPYLHRVAYSGSLRAANEMAEWFKQTYLSGYPIKPRSGKLRASVKGFAKYKGESLIAGISYGNARIPYTRVHISDYAGQPTYIFPKKRKYLAIPVGANEDKELFKSPLNMPYSVLRFPAVGMYSGRTFYPYFILSKGVVLKSKIGMVAVMEQYRKRFFDKIYYYVKERIK